MSPHRIPMTRTNEIKVRLDDDEVARLDERRPAGLTRAQWLRELARGPATAAEVPSREQVIAVLWRMTQDGKVQAAVALERALRTATESAEDEGWLERIVGTSDG